MENGKDLDDGSSRSVSTPDSEPSASKKFKSKVASFQKWIASGHSGHSGKKLRDRFSSASSEMSLTGSMEDISEKINTAVTQEDIPKTATLPASIYPPLQQASVRSTGKGGDRSMTHPTSAMNPPGSVYRTSREHGSNSTLNGPTSARKTPNRWDALHEFHSTAQLAEVVNANDNSGSFISQSAPSRPISSESAASGEETVSTLDAHVEEVKTGVVVRPSLLSSLSGMDRESVHGTRLHERNVEEYMDARSGADETSSAVTFVDEEGIRVRKIKLVSSQNVGFESLPVQFVNKATKSGFVFNILVIGETGIGKSTLINSLFNHDFKLQPGDYQLDSVALDKHTFHLEEGSVRLQLTVIETKGYGDQLNMADSWQGVVEYIDKQYEAYFQEESQIMRRLSDYKDTRVHVCLFLLAPTGSSVRALDLECMKVLGNKVNIIPVIARGDSLTKKEMDTFKRRINDQLRQHKISIYRFPEDDQQVADLNRKMNADVPFAVVGSSDVCEVAGHKTRARVYPWGIVDIENEAHCDFTRFREALLRVNMDHLMQTTHLAHYELYRDRRMNELGYGSGGAGDADGNQENRSFIETITRLRQTNENKYRQKEEETRTCFVNKVREKEAELKERERELHAQFENHRTESHDRMQEVDVQRAALNKEAELFSRVKSELLNHPSGTIKTKKKG